MADILEDAPHTAVSAPTDAPTADPGMGQRRRGIRTWRVGAVPMLAIALFVVVVFAADLGAVTLSPWHTALILLNATHIFHFTPTWPSTDETILLTFHLPHVLGAVLVGMALSVAGVLFQGLLRNPLADPLLLGTSSGAALGATIGFLVPSVAIFAFKWQDFSVIAILAFGGALLAIGLVYLVATRRGQTPVVTLLLAGVAVGAMLTAIQTLIVTFNLRSEQQFFSLYNWISGEINVLGWLQIGVSTMLIAACLVVTLFLAPALDAFALGEEMTAHLGLAVERYKLIIVAVAALLVALAVSMSGLVGFVGLVSPHLCRLAFGPRHRLLIPTAALTGAIFVVLADMLARTVAAPTQIPLGVVTALVGGPFFIMLLNNAGNRYRW